MKKYDVAVVGEIFIDHVFTGFGRWPNPGEEVFAPQYMRDVGGGAAITACALAKLDRSVSLVGIIGNEDANWIVNRLNAFGVSNDGIVQIDGSTGVTVSVSIGEERSFFSHAGVNWALQSMLGSDAVLKVLCQARHVHFALPLEHELALTLLPALKKSGCTTSLDVGFHPDWLRRPENLEICRTVDYFFPNEREAALLCGGEGMDYLTFAQERGLVCPVLKRGRSGAAMIANGVKYESPSLSVSVIDTTGAGDVFDAGFIDAQLDALSPEICLRRACVCGALSTRASGALSAVPDRIELERASELNHGA
jgi:sugar/nucleoside kinase (ribokinase family)